MQKISTIFLSWSDGNLFFNVGEDLNPNVVGVLHQVENLLHLNKEDNLFYNFYMFRLYENWRGNRSLISKFVTQKKISSIYTEVVVAQAKSAGLEADRKFVNLSHDYNFGSSNLYFRL